MDNVISTILIVIVILVVAFLILREVYCWYLKINERITLQEEQKSILVEQNLLIKEQNLMIKVILDELRNEPKTNNKTTSQNKKKDYNSIKNMDKDEHEEEFRVDEKTFDIELTDYEQKQVDMLIKFAFNPRGSCIVINKISREVRRFEEYEWKNVDQSEWIVLFEKL